MIKYLFQLAQGFLIAGTALSMEEVPQSRFEIDKFSGCQIIKYSDKIVVKPNDTAPLFGSKGILIEDKNGRGEIAFFQATHSIEEFLEEKRKFFWAKSVHFHIIPVSIYSPTPEEVSFIDSLEKKLAKASGVVPEVILGKFVAQLPTPLLQKLIEFHREKILYVVHSMNTESNGAYPYLTEEELKETESTLVKFVVELNKRGDNM
jgi:hypothetical protein